MTSIVLKIYALISRHRVTKGVNFFCRPDYRGLKCNDMHQVMDFSHHLRNPRNHNGRILWPFLPSGVWEPYRHKWCQSCDLVAVCTRGSKAAHNLTASSPKKKNHKSDHKKWNTVPIIGNNSQVQYQLPTSGIRSHIWVQNLSPIKFRVGVLFYILQLSCVINWFIQNWALST